MPAKKTKEPSFEDSLAELESIVSSMENDQLPLEKLLVNYEKGNALLKNCQSLLDNARERIEVIKLAGSKPTENKLASDDDAGETENSDAAKSDDIRLF